MDSAKQTLTEQLGIEMSDADIGTKRLVRKALLAATHLQDEAVPKASNLRRLIQDKGSPVSAVKKKFDAVKNAWRGE